MATFVGLCFVAFSLQTSVTDTPKVAGKVDIKKNDRFFVLHLPEGDDECIISPGDEVKRIGSFTSEVKAVSHSRPGVFFVDIDRASTVSSGKREFICAVEQQ